MEFFKYYRNCTCIAADWYGNIIIIIISSHKHGFWCTTGIRHTHWWQWCNLGHVLGLSISLSLSLSIPRSGFPKQKRNSSWILLQREPPPKAWSPERSHRCTFLLAAPQFFFHLFLFFFFFFPKSDQICVLSLSHSSSSSSSVGFFFLAQVFLPLLILPWFQWGCFAFAIPLFCVLPSVSLPLSNGVFLHFSQKKI